MPLIDAHAVKYDATGQTVTDYGPPPGGPKGRMRRACENDRKIAEGAWATALDLSIPILMKYCQYHPHTQNLKWERENMKRRKDLARFFFFDWD
jgi:hypothetical protein